MKHAFYCLYKILPEQSLKLGTELTSSKICYLKMHSFITYMLLTSSRTAAVSATDPSQRSLSTTGVVQFQAN